MLLDSNYAFSLYPDESNYTTDPIEIVLKSYPLNDEMIKKFIVQFAGDSMDAIIETINRFGTVTKEFNGITDHNINYVPNGAWGHLWKITMDGDFNILYQIDVEPQRRF